MPKKKNHTSSRKSARIKAIKEKLKESYEEISQNINEQVGNGAGFSETSHAMAEHSSSSLMEDEEFSTNSCMDLNQQSNMGFSASSFKQNEQSAAASKHSSPQAQVYFEDLDKRIEEARKICPPSIGLGKFLEEKYNISKKELVQSLSRKSRERLVPKENDDLHSHLQNVENISHASKSDFHHSNMNENELQISKNTSASICAEMHLANELVSSPTQNAISHGQNHAILLENFVANAQNFSHGSSGTIEEDGKANWLIPNGFSVGKVHDKPDFAATFSGQKDLFSASPHHKMTAHLSNSNVGGPPLNLNHIFDANLEDFPPLCIQPSGKSAGPCGFEHGTYVAATSFNDATSPMQTNQQSSSQNQYRNGSSFGQQKHSASSGNHITSTPLFSQGIYEANGGSFCDQLQQNTFSTSQPASTSFQAPLQHSAWASNLDWKDHLVGNLMHSLKLDFHEPLVENGRIGAAPPSDVFEEGDGHWKHCLIGQFLDRPPPFFLLRKMVDNHWKKFGKVEIKSAENGFFVFKFENDEYCNQVMEQLWHINHRPLLLRKWDANAQMINFGWEKVPLWVKLRNVPCSLITRRGLSYIASTIGIPLQMDKLTESRTFVGFARVCVEMDLSKSLPEHTYVKLRNGDWAKIDIEYAWKPLVCPSCKIVGHSLSMCQNGPPKNAPRQAPKVIEKKNDNWKMAKNRRVWKKVENFNPTPFSNVVINSVQAPSLAKNSAPIVEEKLENNRFAVLNANEGTSKVKDDLIKSDEENVMIQENDTNVADLDAQQHENQNEVQLIEDNLSVEQDRWEGNIGNTLEGSRTRLEHPNPTPI